MSLASDVTPFKSESTSICCRICGGDVLPSLSPAFAGKTSPVMELP